MRTQLLKQCESKQDAIVVIIIMKYDAEHARGKMQLSLLMNMPIIIRQRVKGDKMDQQYLAMVIMFAAGFFFGWITCKAFGK